MDDRNLRRAAAAAHAGQKNPDVAKALGGQAKEMAETMPPDQVARLAYPEIENLSSADDDTPPTKTKKG